MTTYRPMSAPRRSGARRAPRPASVALAVSDAVGRSLSCERGTARGRIATAGAYHRVTMRSQGLFFVVAAWLAAAVLAVACSATSAGAELGAGAAAYSNAQ